MITSKKNEHLPFSNSLAFLELEPEGSGQTSGKAGRVRGVCVCVCVCERERERERERELGTIILCL